MRFPGIRLVEQTEQKFRRIRVCLEEKKTSDCNNRALLLIKAPTKKVEMMPIDARLLKLCYI